MNPRSLATALVLAVGAMALLAWTPAVTLGPPWISIEYPPSPYDQTTRGAYLLVHSFHHGTPVEMPVAGAAEGIVDGRRRSVKLDFTRTSRTGVYALRKQWPEGGTWMLRISVTQGHGSGNTVTALVDIGGDGQVASVKVPTRRQNGWDVPVAVTDGEIDAALQARISLASRGR